jgi:glycosyltransferase involved in cell wall biosynthesis
MSGVNIIRGGAWLKFPKNGIMRRAVLEVGYLLHLLRHLNRIKYNNHIVAVFPPMLFLPLLRLVSGHGSKITVIMHDLQGVMASVDLNKKNSNLLVSIEFLERCVLRCSQKVIALSRNMASHIVKFYHYPSSKLSVCWPFVSIDTQSKCKHLAHLFAQGKKHIVYAGALGKKQNPQFLISFFGDLVSWRDDIVCHVFSAGPIFQTFRRKQKSTNGRLIFHNLVPNKDLFELYQCSNIQIILEKKGLSKGAIPSKLPNLLASGVPILYIGEQESDVWRIVETYSAGACSDQLDASVLLPLVDKLLREGELSSHKERRVEFDRKFQSLFDMERLIQELVH